jgi:tol-pal system protein YbgF
VRWGALGLLVSGCGTARSPARGAGPPGAAASDRNSEQTFAELRAKNAGYVRRIEELENRVFILEDQLDSRKRATERRTPSPLVVTRSLGVNAAGGELRPGAAPEAPPLAEPGSAPESLVNEEVVEYVGDARGAPVAARSSSPSSRKLARRPHLRLWPGGAGAHPGARTQAASRAATPEDQGFLAAAGGPGKREEGGGDAGGPARLYRESLAALRAGQHEQAVAGFQRFLESYPQHVDADNAQYWIAESHYDRAQFDLSEREFRAVIERYPDGRKVADAMLKRGLSLYYLGDQARSRSVLQALTRAFPRREAAELARAQLAHPAELPAARAATSSTPTSTALPAAQARLASP